MSPLPPRGVVLPVPDFSIHAIVPTTRRFLSGGANDLVKLCEVNERPVDEGVDGEGGDRKDGSRGGGSSSRA